MKFSVGDTVALKVDNIMAKRFIRTSVAFLNNKHFKTAYRYTVDFHYPRTIYDSTELFITRMVLIEKYKKTYHW
ncbi:MAG: hypothetical protein Q8O88_04095 [bacterium]|nr:hypothetical protein [bacterium]